MSLSACTVQLYLYSPYGPYGLYRASVPVQYSYTSTPPAGRTASTSLSACTRAHFTFYFLVFRMPCMSSPSVFVLHPLQQYICICNCVSIENKACICKTCTIERLPD